MKRGKSVVLALMIVVILGCSFFVIEKSITGNITFVGPYKVYGEKTKTIKVPSGDKYDVEVVSISSDAALFVVDNSEAIAISEGQTKQVGNLQIKVFSASLGNWLSGANVKFSVAEAESGTGGSSGATSGTSDGGDGGINKEVLYKGVDIPFDRMAKQAGELRQVHGDYNSISAYTLSMDWKGNAWDCQDMKIFGGGYADARLFANDNTNSYLEGEKTCLDKELNNNFWNLDQSSGVCRCVERFNLCTHENEFAIRCGTLIEGTYESEKVTLIGNINGRTGSTDAYLIKG